jgi:type IV pilus assembly protein PilB
MAMETPPPVVKPTPRIRLGQLLVDAKILSLEQLERVLETQKSDGRRLGTLLVESGFVTETQVTQILSQQLSVPWVSLYHIDFSRQLLNLVPKEVAEKYCLVPIYVRHVRKQGDTLYVAMDDPTNEVALQECSQWSGLPARAMIAAPSDIRNAIRVYYGGGKPSVVPPAPSPAPAPPAPSSVRPKSPPPARPAPSDPPVSLREADFVVSPPPPAVSEAVTDAPPPPSRTRASQPASAQVEPAAAAPPSSSSRSAPPSSAASQSAPPSSPAPQSAPPSSRSSRPSPAPKPAVDEGPEVEVREVEIPRPAKGKGSRMIALTFLDGTTISLPAARKRDAKTRAKSEPPPAEARESSPPASERAPDSSDDDQLTARDLVAALRAVAHGADASDILGDNVKWEKMFAALLSVLLRKHLIADWEFVEELKKI